MEMDRSIALFERENREREKEEQKNLEKEKYDPKKRITYTLDQLIAGIKKGKQYIYTLKLCFEIKVVFDGKLRIPYITDFFDVIEEREENLLYVSNKRNVSMVVTLIPCSFLEPLEEWAGKIKSTMKEMNLHIKQMRLETVHGMQYMCYEVPTAEGNTYNVLFRFLKDQVMYTGSFNCMDTEKEGIGLLLEAMVHVIAEKNA